MIAVKPGYESLALEMLASETAPSGEQKTALAAELNTDPAGRGYAGKSAAEVLALLCEPYSAPNPEPQGAVNVPSTIGALKAWFRPIIAAAPDPLKAKWGPVFAQQVAFYGDSEAVERTSLTFAPFAAAALADGLIAPSDLDALFTQLDPSYSATLYHPARIREVWPVEIGDAQPIPTLADIEEAMG